MENIMKYSKPHELPADLNLCDPWNEYPIVEITHTHMTLRGPARLVKSAFRVPVIHDAAITRDFNPTTGVSLITIESAYDANLEARIPMCFRGLYRIFPTEEPNVVSTILELHETSNRDSVKVDFDWEPNSSCARSIGTKEFLRNL